MPRIWCDIWYLKWETIQVEDKILFVQHYRDSWLELKLKTGWYLAERNIVIAMSMWQSILQT